MNRSLLGSYQKVNSYVFLLFLDNSVQEVRVFTRYSNPEVWEDGGYMDPSVIPHTTELDQHISPIDDMVSGLTILHRAVTP